MLGYESPVSILSGKIHANSGNQFHIFNSFSIDLWIIFCITIIIVAICEHYLHIQTTFSFIKFIFKLLSSIFYLIIRFLNQDSMKFSRICCFKHLLNSFPKLRTKNEPIVSEREPLIV